MSRILVVEDSHTQAEFLRLLLESAGYAVKVTSDGEAALGILRTSHFDLVLTDVVMPGIDGVELCRRVKADPGSAHASARGGSETLLLVEDEEAVRVLTSAALRKYGYSVLEAGDGVVPWKLGVRAHKAVRS